MYMSDSQVDLGAIGLESRIRAANARAAASEAETGTSRVRSPTRATRPVSEEELQAFTSEQDKMTTELTAAAAAMSQNEKACPRLSMQDEIRMSDTPTPPATPFSEDELQAGVRDAEKPVTTLNGPVWAELEEKGHGIPADIDKCSPRTIGCWAKSDQVTDMAGAEYVEKLAEEKHHDKLSRGLAAGKDSTTFEVALLGTSDQTPKALAAAVLSVVEKLATHPAKACERGFGKLDDFADQVMQKILAKTTEFVVSRKSLFEMTDESLDALQAWQTKAAALEAQLAEHAGDRGSVAATARKTTGDELRAVQISIMEEIQTVVAAMDSKLSCRVDKLDTEGVPGVGGKKARKVRR